MVIKNLMIDLISDGQLKRNSLECVKKMAQIFEILLKCIFILFIKTCLTSLDQSNIEYRNMILLFILNLLNYLL